MTLIKKLETATGGSRELSDECLLAVGWDIIYGPKLGLKKGSERWFPFSGNLPDPSQNVQDAIDWMVPEGWYWGVDSRSWAVVDPAEGHEGKEIVFDGSPCLVETKAATPALALSAASLKAHAAVKETDG